VNLIEKVKAALERENLIPAGASIVVGVSGGADSVALLHLLHQLGYSVTAAHLNHSIRGAEADGDEAFVKDLCKKLGIECVTAKTDVPALAKAKGISLEMAAREARHEFFRSVLRPPSSVICLAHHADDQLETFFLRAARGTGPGGLGGMRSFQELTSCQPCNVVGQASLYPESLCSSQKQGNTRSRVREARPTIHDRALEGLTLVRPMLGIRRAEIIQWLEKEKIEWREDATNTDETISRNLVRRQIVPVLGQLNERAAENILRTMELLRDEEDHPEKAARRREIRDWLIEHGVTPTFDTIEQVVSFSEKTNGTQFMDVEGLRLINEYGELRAECGRGFQPLASGRMPLPQKMTIKTEEGLGILRGPWCASVSLAKVAGRKVMVRTARLGDRMEPYGMEGSKKLQDIFTDLKIPKAQREQWLVVECGGEIIWLPGYRIARGWELLSDTEPALYLFMDAGTKTTEPESGTQ
jgi:tRNA(Ile)-lysidine synthase